MNPKKKAWYNRWWSITLFVIIGFIILVSLFGGNDSSELKISNTNSETASAKDQTYSLGEFIQAGDFKWKITTVDTAKTLGSNPYLIKEANGVFLILDVEVENTGKSAVYLMDSYLKLIDSQGREFSPDSSAAVYLDPNSALVFEQINPGLVKKGKIIFEIPTDVKTFDVKISSNAFSSKTYNVKIKI